MDEQPQDPAEEPVQEEAPEEPPAEPPVEPSEEPKEPSEPIKKEKTLVQVKCRKCGRYFGGRSLLYNHRKECNLDLEEAKKDVREHIDPNHVGVSRTNKKPKAKAKPAEPAEPEEEIMRPPSPQRFVEPPIYVPFAMKAMTTLREQRALRHAALREERSRRMALLARDAF